MPARLIEVRRGEEPISTHTTSYNVDERDIDHYGHLNNRGGPKILAETRSGLESPNLQVSGFSTSYGQQVFAGDKLLVRTELYTPSLSSQIIYQEAHRDGSQVLRQATRLVSDLSQYNPDDFPAFSLADKPRMASTQGSLTLPGRTGEPLDHTDYLPVFQDQRHTILDGKGYSLEDLQKKRGVMIVLAHLDLAIGRSFTAGEKVTTTTHAALDTGNERMGYVSMVFIQRMQDEKSHGSVIQLSRCAVIDTETGKPRILPRDIEENLRSST